MLKDLCVFSLLFTSLSVYAVIPEGNASGTGAIAVGTDSTADKDLGISIGVDASSKYIGTAIGAFSESGGNMDIAIGALAKTQDGSSALAIGTKSNVSSLPEGNNTAISGKQITKNGESFSVISVDEGRETLKEKYGETYGAIAIGLAASSHDMFNTALGGYSTAAAQNATAIGHSASALSNNSVAIGDSSIADRQNTLSVGNAYTKRQITNVESGTEDNDAVNVSQLKKEAGERVAGDAATLTAAKNYSDAGNKQTLKTANEYSDAGDAKTLQTAKNYSDTGDDRILNSANNYTNTAVKKSNANTLYQANQYTNQKFSELRKVVDENRKRSDAGIAGAMAMTAIAPVPYKDYSFGMAAGGYRDQGAIAAGINIRTSENSLMKVNTAWDTQNGGGIAAGFNVGW
ncbi:TPA: hypothetical protein J1W36_004556 [Escherichia coli]|nr:hypothetical protein [Escherichia coli]HBA8154535.1 hypothetical protein [Escherichia coli]